MDQEAEARSEYLKFFVLLLFFGALTVGAALLRPMIQGGRQIPPPTDAPTTSTLSVQIMATPTVTPTPQPTSEPTSLPSPTPTITPTATVAPPTYIVQAGDNLFRIGQQFGLTVEELATANHISDPNLIRVGQILTLPGADTPLPVDTPPPADTYIIQWGDTLWGISRRFGVDIDVLIAANDISNPSKIRAGQVLEIPH